MKGYRPRRSEPYSPFGECWRSPGLSVGMKTSVAGGLVHGDYGGRNGPRCTSCRQVTLLHGISFNVPLAAPVRGVHSGQVHAGLPPGLDSFRMTIAREDLDHPDDNLMATYGFCLGGTQIRP